MWPAQFADGPGLRGPSFPSPPGSPSAFYFGENINGALNAGLTNGGNGGTWKSLGTLTGADLIQAGAANGTYKTGARNCMAFGATAWAQSAAWSAPLTQPTLIAMVFKINTAALDGTAYYACDGLNVGNRAFFYDNNFMNIGAGGSIASASIPTVRGSYNIMLAYYDGATSQLELNRQAQGTIPGVNIGSNTLTGFTIAAALNGSSPMIGDFVSAIIWNGAGMPTFTTQGGWDVVYDWFEAIYNVGWPKTALTAIATPAPSATPGTTHITGGNHVCFAGDSLSDSTHQWYGIPSTGFVASMNARLTTPVVVQIEGVSGNTMAQLNARVATIVALSPQPDVVVTLIGVNDTTGGATVGGTPLDVFKTNCQQYYDALVAGIPGVKLISLPILCREEYYPDPLLSHIAQYNNVHGVIAQAHGANWVDSRAAQQVFEAANNTPPPGIAFGAALLTTDGIHTGLASGGFNPNGGVLIGNTIMPTLTFSG